MLSIFFPRTCAICGNVLRKGVFHICPACLAALPYTRELGVVDNTTHQRFADIPEVEIAAGYIFYRPQTASAELLEQIKYLGQSRLAVWMGERMGRAAADAGMLRGLDCIIPVPLYLRKRLHRGYNQSERLAAGVAKVCGAPVIEAFSARAHKTQTALTTAGRRSNVAGVFRLQKRVKIPSRGAAPTVLLIDDVCTTGATLGEMARVLAQAYPGVRIRILTLGTTVHG